jgi:hypothetical protein
MIKNQTTTENKINKKNSMVTNISSNPCIRCGKERIVIETLKEYVGESLIVTTVMSCPDPDCQRKLDEKFEKERLDREKLKVDGYAKFKNRSSKDEDD